MKRYQYCLLYFFVYLHDDFSVVIVADGEEVSAQFLLVFVGKVIHFFHVLNVLGSSTFVPNMIYFLMPFNSTA